MVLRDGEVLQSLEKCSTDEGNHSKDIEVTSKKMEMKGSCLWDKVNSDSCVVQGLASIYCMENQNNQRAPLVLVSVVDVSASMRGRKLQSMQTTLRFLISKLQSTDRFAIIDYNDTSRISFPLTYMTEAAKVEANNATNLLKATGSTNLCDALMEGIRLIPEHFEDTVIASVLVMTDGMANIGTSSTAGILSQTQFCLREYPSLPINTFGYGAKHDANLLQKIAEASQGMYYFIESNESISGSFADCLGGLLSVCGQSVELVLQDTEKAKIASVHASTFPCTKTDTGYRVCLGEIQFGEKRDILLDIKLEASEMPCALQDIAKLSLSYFDVVTEEIVEEEAFMSVDRFHTCESIVPKMNLLVDMHCNRIAVCEALNQASSLIEEGDPHGAIVIIQRCINRIMESESRDEPMSKLLIKDLQSELHPPLKHRNGMRSSCSIRQKSLSYSLQRSSGSSSRMFDSINRKSLRVEISSFEGDGTSLSQVDTKPIPRRKFKHRSQSSMRLSSTPIINQ